MINVKKGVVFKIITPEVMSMMKIVEDVWRVSFHKDPTITSANDSTHMQGSKHFENDALDWRSQDLSGQQKATALTELKKRLNPLGYDVLLEGLGKSNEHFHVEYDPK